MTAETSVPSTALLTGAGGIVDKDSSNYTARHLLVLEGLEAVRKRPGMYIGSTDSRGLMHCLWKSSTTPSMRPWAAIATTSRSSSTTTPP